MEKVNYGINLDDRADFDRLRPRLLAWRPFLLIYEITCTLWSNVQYINYSKVQLAELRQTQDLAIKEMCRTITENWELNHGYFLIENPAYTKFWDHPAVQRLKQLPGVEFRVGAMCAHDLVTAKASS